jgi:3-phosphoshikimate 1-carboxyvinyltransferase
MLPEELALPPFTHPVRGGVALPGSKSITNRALLLAAFCQGPVAVENALFSEDTALMAEALRRLGFNVTEDAAARRIAVEGRGGLIPSREATIHVGLAGTAARFLTALCAAAPAGIFRLDGVPQMRKRPMRPLLEALRALGADIRCTGEEGFLPLEIRAHGLDGGTVAIDASESSQLLSALLMVAPLARHDTTISLRGGARDSYVAMTLRMMQEFSGGTGIASEIRPGSWRISSRPQPYSRATGRYAVEADASAASYFLALPVVTGGQLALHGAQDSQTGLQGDTEFADVVRQIGATVAAGPAGLEVSFGTGTARAAISGRNFHAISDTFLTLAAIAPLLNGPTRITGIAHTRKQETDRVAGMARELTKLGQHVVEEPDALTITPRPLVSGQVIETYGDHRFAMSFGILGCHDLHRDGRPWLTLRNPACCAKTFPNFFELLEELRRKSSEA